MALRPTTGALVVAEPEALRVARPSYLSQQAYENDGRFVPKDSAARFDPTRRDRVRRRVAAAI